MEAVKNKDIEALKAMMNPNMAAGVDDLDAELNKLANYPQGDIPEYEYFYQGDEKLRKEGFSRIRERAIMDFTTSEGSYRIAFHYEDVNTYAPENKGVSFLQIYDLNTDETIVLIRAASDGFFGR
jgi:hypothetical protein